MNWEGPNCRVFLKKIFIFFEKFFSADILLGIKGIEVINYEQVTSVLTGPNSNDFAFARFGVHTRIKSLLKCK